MIRQTSHPGASRSPLFAVREFLLCWGLFLLCLGFHQWQARSIDPQASMDAGYYHILADRLLSGKGFTEPFIWHHLQPYTQIERPIDYWLPMGSILFAGARILAASAGMPASSGEIGLNHLLWAVLSVLVFRLARRTTGRPLLGLFAWAFVAFGGKFAFYLSTTDNTAFYAVLGFLLLSALSELSAPRAMPGKSASDASDGRPPSPTDLTGLIGLIAGFAGGMMALTRAEGLIFFAFALLFLTLRGGWRQALLALVVGAAIMAPWILRNQELLGTPWPSHPRAFWVRHYNEMFEPVSPGSFAELTRNGLREPLLFRLSALRQNLADFLVVPAHLLFVPFWMLGAWRRSRPDKALFIGLPVFLWLFVSICFPAQSRNGIGLHISAAFFPHAAVLSAEALSWLAKEGARFHRAFTLFGRPPLLTFFICWIAGFTLAGTELSNQSFDRELAPYRELLTGYRFPLPGPIASTDPVRTFLFTQQPGVCVPPSTSNDAAAFALRYGCSSIILDAVLNPFDRRRLEFPGWKVVASGSRLLILVKKDRP